jgi:hypothetical protein
MAAERHLDILTTVICCVSIPGQLVRVSILKTIYTGFSAEFWKLIAARLADQSDWEPVYWVGDPKMETEVRALFPGAIFHSIFAAVKGIPSQEYSPRSCEPLDTETLAEFAPHQAILLRMMDRIDALGSFTFNDRMRLLFTTIKYWRSVLDDLQPDVVVFSVIPHMIYDYVLYLFCKQREIKTLMFESIPVRGLTIIMDDFEAPTHTAELYNQLLEGGDIDQYQISTELDEFLDALKGSYAEAPVYVRRVYKEEPYKGIRAPSGSIFEKLLNSDNYQQYFTKLKARTIRRFSAPENYLKQKHKKLEESQMNLVQHHFFRVRANIRLRSLIRHYHKLAEDVDFERPYIYVALSFQPERTSSPMGSYYVEQHLALDLLSKTVPEGWHIYAKEHPFEFTPSMSFRAQSGRSYDYYDDIAALPNVSLVPMPINSYQMIDSSQAVAALTGTVGWETIYRGKAALIFGFPWYRGCEGVFHIDTRQSLENALEQIQSGYQVDQKKLRLFAYALEQTAIRASVEPHLRIEAYSDEEAAERITHAIQAF